MTDGSNSHEIDANGHRRFARGVTLFGAKKPTAKTTTKKPSKNTAKNLRMMQALAALSRMLPQPQMEDYYDPWDYYGMYGDLYNDYMYGDEDYYNPESEMIPKYQYYYARAPPAALMMQYQYPFLNPMFLKTQWLKKKYLWKG